MRRGCLRPRIQHHMLMQMVRNSVAAAPGRPAWPSRQLWAQFASWVGCSLHCGLQCLSGCCYLVIHLWSCISSPSCHSCPASSSLCANLHGSIDVCDREGVRFAMPLTYTPRCPTNCSRGSLIAARACLARNYLENSAPGYCTLHRTTSFCSAWRSRCWTLPQAYQHADGP